MCPLGWANVSSFSPDVSDFRLNVSRFWLNVSTFEGNVSSFRPDVSSEEGERSEGREVRVGVEGWGWGAEGRRDSPFDRLRTGHFGRLRTGFPGTPG